LRVRWLAVLTCLLAAFAVGMTACGGDDDDDGGGGGGGNELTVYSSLPLQGAQRLQTLAVVDGIKLALKERGGKVGDFTFKYESLDDSTAQAGTWTPEATSANARKAAQDESTIAYIGEFNSGASAISIPILNEVPIPQISPANTGVGLTSDEPGADEGEPEKYYPTGVRHYLRVVPKDTIQGAALATLMKKDGCTKLAILNDKEVYGAGLARNIEGSAKEQGIEVTGNEGIDPKAPNFRSQASAIKSDGADCFVFSGVTPNGAVQLYKDIAAALPDAQLYGPDGVSNPEFYNPDEGGVPPDIASRVKITVATLNPEQYPPEGRKFFKEFSKEYGVKNPDVYSIYGYESMSLVLDTCKELGSDCSDKQKMVEALHNIKGRKSVLGTYDIDKNGDTSITDYGVYTVKGGELVFDQTIKASS
jgi:branched-chain amino acid transport system substrate-binding protein